MAVFRWPGALLRRGRRRVATCSAYAPAGGAWRSINLGSRTSWTLTGLRNGTRYYVYLYAVHSGGRSPAARVSALLPSGTPRSYRVTGVGNGRVSLAWSTPAAGPPTSGYLLSLRAGWRDLAQHQPRIANELDAHRTAQWHEVLRVSLRPAQRLPIACRQSHRRPPVAAAPPNYSGNCPAATNTPGGRDPWGGCWPGPSNTGVPSGVALSAYTGPCRITTPNAVIDRRVVNCDLEIAASGVVIRNSRINGTVGMAGGSLTISDSEVVGGAPEPNGYTMIGDRNITIVRVEVVGGTGGSCATAGASCATRGCTASSSLATYMSAASVNPRERR